MNLRSLWSNQDIAKPTSDALEYITKRINLIWTREHNGDTGAHVFPVGRWTPTIGGTGGQSGQVYAQQDGFYVKAGQLVHATCRVQLSTLGTITGAVQIQGLPFPALNSVGYRVTGSVVWTTTTTAYINMVAVVSEGSSAIDLVAAAAVQVSLSTQSLAQANLANTTRFVVSLLYQAAEA